VGRGRIRRGRGRPPGRGKPHPAMGVAAF
jgi:hypothetical protein